MIPFLADLPTPSGVQFSEFTVNVFAGLMGLKIVLEIWDRVKGKPGHPANDILEKRLDKLEGDFKKERDDNEAHMSERSSHIYQKLDETANRLDLKMNAQMEKSEESRARLHERIDPIALNTAEIKGRMESFTDSFKGFTEIIKGNLEAQKATTDVLKAMLEHLKK